MNAILAIDGGGTRTRAGLYDEQGALLAEAEGDATNLSKWPVSHVVRTIAMLAGEVTKDSNHTIRTVLAGISGAGRTGQAQAVATGLAQALGTSDVRVCSDAHMLSFANLDVEHPILVIAGTGSAVITRRADGSRVVTGGWGPVLGDEGGAYRLALEGIRRADEDEPLRKALVAASGEMSLPALHLRLGVQAPAETAELSTVVTREAEAGNIAARGALRDQAEKLAALARHGLTRAGIDVDVLASLHVLVTGGLMDCELYLDEFASALLPEESIVIVERPRLAGHRAALEIRRMPTDATYVGKPNVNGDVHAVHDILSQSTEGAFEWMAPLESMNGAELSNAMNMSEVLSDVAVRRAKQILGRAIETAAACIRAGGRIIYAGAGTSGRLGVLDASECPPTFGVDEGRVIGLIAGGEAALRHSIEGAEDDTAAAARDIDAIVPKVGKNDIVIGITASGTTPYALAAIDRGKALGAKTALVCCNAAPRDRADIVIALETGPEVLPGSTRLKAGTATKMVLNQISTGAMAKAGYVFEGRMVGVRPLNKKLRQRCIRIIAELTNEDAARAEQRLDETGGSIRLAVLMARKGLPLDEARRRLDACQGVLRDALEMK
jgi:N-acetylmuramic acid 6-phosphate etherase